MTGKYHFMIKHDTVFFDLPEDVFEFVLPSVTTNCIETLARYFDSGWPFLMDKNAKQILVRAGLISVSGIEPGELWGNFASKYATAFHDYKARNYK